MGTTPLKIDDVYHLRKIIAAKKYRGCGASSPTQSFQIGIALLENINRHDHHRQQTSPPDVGRQTRSEGGLVDAIECDTYWI